VAGIGLKNTNVKTNGATFCGSYNSEGYSYEDPKFVVGIGDGNTLTQRKNGLIVYENGSVEAPNQNKVYKDLKDYELITKKVLDSCINDREELGFRYTSPISYTGGY
jgi:hypothetical protein